jgi:hypothetical protein
MELIQKPKMSDKIARPYTISFLRHHICCHNFAGFGRGIYSGDELDGGANIKGRDNKIDYLRRNLIANLSGARLTLDIRAARWWPDSSLSNVWPLTTVATADE